MQLVIVSGLSGAGKSVALRQFEDLGWYCIDNLPLDLVQPLLEHALAHPQPRYDHIAIGIDARADAREIEHLPRLADALREAGVELRVLFLTAAADTLIRRYAETRRPHPLADAQSSLEEAVRHERRLLKPVADLADEVIDTSTTNLHQLRAAVEALMPDGARRGLHLSLLSFGYKNGLPDGVDFVFDARCLPNPHWIPTLRPMSGRDPAVADYLRGQETVVQYADAIERFLRLALPGFSAQNRHHLTVAVGCTGGRHRSVWLVEHLSRALADVVERSRVHHRDLG
jgi:Predicted P-loop-containing kinase